MGSDCFFVKRAGLLRKNHIVQRFYIGGVIDFIDFHSADVHNADKGLSAGVFKALRADDPQSAYAAPSDADTSYPPIVTQETKVLATSGAPTPLPETPEEETTVFSNQVSLPEYALDEEEDDEDDIIRVTPEKPTRVRKPMGKGWIAWILVLILLTVIGYGGYYYYSSTICRPSTR